MSDTTIWSLHYFNASQILLTSFGLCYGTDVQLKNQMNPASFPEILTQQLVSSLQQRWLALSDRQVPSSLLFKENNILPKEGKEKKEVLPEQKPLSWLLPDNVQFVVVTQRSGHFLIGHVCSVLFVHRRKREKKKSTKTQ